MSGLRAIDIYSRCGLTRYRNNRFGPCPACGANRTSQDKRPPVLLSKGWRCYACGATGDAFNLVSYVIGLDGRTDGKRFVLVKEWIESGGIVEVNVEELEEQPARIDPMPALRAAVPLSACRDPRLKAWLARRGISAQAPAGWLEDYVSDWWPMGYARRWPVVIPACTGRGEVVSMHGVAVDPPGQFSKTRWPKGASSKELLFAAPSLRDWMAGRAQPPDRVLIVEGATDYLTASTHMPTLGYFSGSANALRTLQVTAGTKIYCGVDADEKGDMYEDEIANALAPHPVRRLPLRRLHNAS